MLWCVLVCHKQSHHLFMICFNLLWIIQGLCFLRMAENNGFCISVTARETFLSFLFWMCEVHFATQVPQNCFQAASIPTCYSAPEPHPLPSWPGHRQGCFSHAFSHFSQPCSIFFLFSQKCLQAPHPCGAAILWEAGAEGASPHTGCTFPSMPSKVSPSF